MPGRGFSQLFEPRRKSDGAGHLRRSEKPDGKEIFPTFEPGSELGWNLLAGQQAASVAAEQFHLRGL